MKNGGSLPASMVDLYNSTFPGSWNVTTSGTKTVSGSAVSHENGTKENLARNQASGCLFSVATDYYGTTVKNGILWDANVTGAYKSSNPIPYGTQTIDVTFTKKECGASKGIVTQVYLTDEEGNVVDSVGIGETSIDVSGVSKNPGKSYYLNIVASDSFSASIITGMLDSECYLNKITFTY